MVSLVSFVCVAIAHYVEHYVYGVIILACCGALILVVVFLSLWCCYVYYGVIASFCLYCCHDLRGAVMLLTVCSVYFLVRAYTCTCVPISVMPRAERILSIRRGMTRP